MPSIPTDGLTPTRLLGRRRWCLLAAGITVILFLFGAPPAAAERFFLGKICKVKDLEVPAAERTCFDLEEFAKDIAPAEIYMFRGAPTFSGRILAFQRGLRSGNEDQPTNHDRILIEAYGPGGTPVSARPVLLSAYHISVASHDIDTHKDFTNLFSNRHELTGVAVGSQAHRDLIYELIDPDGMQGLFQGGGLLAEKAGDVEEGAITRYIRFGPTNPASLDTVWTSNQTDARQHLHWRDFRRLIWGIAAARTMPGFEEGFAEAGLQLTGLWCSLVDADPKLARPDLIMEVTRAFDVGRQCYEDVHRALHPAAHGVDYRRPGARQDNPNMLVEPVPIVLTALDVILNENSFKLYPGADPLDDRSTYYFPSSTRSRLHFETDRPGAPLDSLLKLAAGQSPYATPEVRAKAEQAAIQIAFDNPDESEADRLFYEIDRRYYKAYVVPRIGQSRFRGGRPAGYDWSDPLSQVQTKLMCRYGWGHIEDLEPYLRAWIWKGAFDAFIAGSPPYPDGSHAAYAGNMGRLIGAIAATAGVDPVHGEAILSVLHEEIDAAEERIKGELEKIEPDMRMIRLYSAFKTAYDAEAANPKVCNPD